MKESKLENSVPTDYVYIIPLKWLLIIWALQQYQNSLQWGEPRMVSG